MNGGNYIINCKIIVNLLQYFGWKLLVNKTLNLNAKILINKEKSVAFLN